MLIVGRAQTQKYRNTVCLAHLCVADDEGRVSRHEEVAPRGGDEGRHQPDQVVVHVARVPQGGGRGGHHRADDGVELPHSGVWDAQTIDLRGAERRRVERWSACVPSDYCSVAT